MENTFKLILPENKRLLSIKGELRLSEDSEFERFQKVELWLLNEETNRNNWRYEKIEEHRRFFAETPILVAYVGDKIGDGHNMQEITDENGDIVASFMKATAERIVGYFKSDSDIRIEIADGKKWIVGTGYIWRWYAQELVQFLKKQGFSGMPVSIETLINEMHKDGTTEVFTSYEILGTTILGTDVLPAVVGANIRALSALGATEVKKITMRVASAEENKSAKKQIFNKGENTQMLLNEIQAQFPNNRVLAVNGNNVVLLGEKGALISTTVVKDGNDVVVGAKKECAAIAKVAVDDDASVDVPVENILLYTNSRIEELEKELQIEKDGRVAVETALNAMQKAEKERRAEAVKKAVKERFENNKEDFGCEFDEKSCDELLTDEAVDAYCEIEKDGKFIGDQKACEDVDALCMKQMRESRKNARRNEMTWQERLNALKESENEAEGAVSAIQSILD